MRNVRKMWLIPAGACVLLGLLAACKPADADFDPDYADARLLDLSMSSGTLTPGFEAETTTYSATVASDVAAITVTATKQAPGARIEIRVNGGDWEEAMSGSPAPACSLEEGANTVEIRVTAADTTTVMVYSVYVHRLSADALLSALVTSAGVLDPGFDPNTVVYALAVANAVDAMTVTPTAAQAAATVQVRVNGGGWQAVISGSPSGGLPLVEGDNLVEIKVTAEDSLCANTYSIAVRRTSANAQLSALTLSAGTLTPTFDSSVNSYAATVGSSVALLKVTATAADVHASIYVQANGGVWQLCTPGVPSSALMLAAGDNTVVVQVTAEDGATQLSYTLSVRRKRGNAELSSLLVSPGTLKPDFSSSTLSYALTVLNAEDSMTVTPTAADNLAAIQVQANGAGWQALPSGDTSSPLGLNLGTNLVEVRVTAEDTAVVKTYTVSAARRFPGAVDVEFATGAAGINCYALALQTDGKVLVGGNTYTGSFWGRIARLESDGTADSSFLNIEEGDWGGTDLRALEVQSDGKILVGGNFTTYDGSSRGYIARLESDGTVDATFLASGVGASSSVYTIQEQGDGKTLIGGTFTTYNGTSRGRIARLNDDGSLDTMFLASDAGANGSVSAIAVQGDGRVLIGGSFTSCNATARGNIARLNDDGSLDTTFLSTGSGAQGSMFPWDPAVRSILVLASGKILIGGTFTTYNGTSRSGVALLNSDGSLDTSFPASGGGTNASVRILALQSDGKILIGGEFSTYDGVNRQGLARLNDDGTLDTSFMAIGTGAAGTVYGVAVQADGKILVGGSFDSFNGTASGKVVRLWPD